MLLVKRPTMTPEKLAANRPNGLKSTGTPHRSGQGLEVDDSAQTRSVCRAGFGGVS